VSAAKAVIFDMDGLMYDSERLAREAYRTIEVRHGFELPDSLLDSVMGFVCSEVKRRLQEYFDAEGISADARDIYRERNDLIMEMVYENGVPEKPGLRELIEYAHSADKKLAVASAASPGRVDVFLKKSGLSESFDVVVNGGDVRNGKPDPEIFLTAADRLGLAPEECLVLEDSNNGVLAAAAAGIPVIVIPDRTEPSGEAQRLAAAVLPSLTNVMIWL
jgi:HAD superfamily hydrolase (TIGR01509 family)